jgi:methionyl aminopeptidase
MTPPEERNDSNRGRAASRGRVAGRFLGAFAFRLRGARRAAARGGGSLLGRGAAARRGGLAAVAVVLGDRVAFRVEFDEFIVVARAGRRGRLAFEHRVGGGAGVELHRTDRVVVARDRVVDQGRVVVGVDHRDDRDAELLGFQHRDVLVPDVDHEQRVRQAVHVLDAAQRLLELLALATQLQHLVLDQLREAAVGFAGFQLLEAVDRTLHGAEVGEHAAQPARRHVRHAATLGFFLDRLARAALGAHEQDRTAPLREARDEVHRVAEQRHGLLEVDDVDLAAGAEDVRRHLGVPVAGLVAEMDAGFQHLAHGDLGHCCDSWCGIAPVRRPMPGSARGSTGPGLRTRATIPGLGLHAVSAPNLRSVDRRHPGTGHRRVCGFAADVRRGRFGRARGRPQSRGSVRRWPNPAQVGDTRGMSITVKTPEQIEKMRVAGRLAAEVLQVVAPHVKPGVTTEELDRVCHDHIVNVQKAIPANVGYKGFPATICTSVNNVICHGIPSPQKVLRDGDIINIDVTVIKDGWHGDTSRMYFVGQPSTLARRLVEVTREAMWRGIRAVKPGATLGDIGHAIQSYAEAERFSVVREYCGHGIGEVYHEDPQILHYGVPQTGIPLRPGMTFTVEPMINAGARHTRLMPDGWTVVTKDRSLSAQWEHTIVVTETGFDVLTRLPGDDNWS